MPIQQHDAGGGGDGPVCQCSSTMQVGGRGGGPGAGGEKEVSRGTWAGEGERGRKSESSRLYLDA